MNDLLTIPGASDLIDVAAFWGVHSDAAKAAVTRIWRHRHERARETLFTELQAGNISLIDAKHHDEFVAIWLRYSRAAHEGAAHTNLRLLARIIAGMLVHSELIADEFLYYADTLAGLRRPELMVLGVLHRHRKAFEAEANAPASPAKAPYARMAEELVPSVFSDANHLMAICNSLTRTGLVVIDSGDHAPFYGTSFTTSPLMDKLEVLASVEGVTVKEAE